MPLATFAVPAVRRALRMAAAEGLKVTRIEFDKDGGFALVCGDAGAEAPQTALERWKGTHHAKAAASPPPAAHVSGRTRGK
jgi:hypothetical protein